MRDGLAFWGICPAQTCDVTLLKHLVETQANILFKRHGTITSCNPFSYQFRMVRYDMFCVKLSLQCIFLTPDCVCLDSNNKQQYVKTLEVLGTIITKVVQGTNQPHCQMQGKAVEAGMQRVKGTHCTYSVSPRTHLWLTDLRQFPKVNGIKIR